MINFEIDLVKEKDLSFRLHLPTTKDLNLVISSVMLKMTEINSLTKKAIMTDLKMD